MSSEEPEYVLGFLCCHISLQRLMKLEKNNHRFRRRHGIMTLSITILSIMCSIATLSVNDIQLNNTQHKHSVIMLRLLCWVSHFYLVITSVFMLNVIMLSVLSVTMMNDIMLSVLSVTWWTSLCWVLLCWVSLCWVS
jgi:hypothetical protein